MAEIADSDTRLKAFYIGFVFTLMLGGVALEMAARYFYYYRNDPLTFKLIVIILSVLNLLHSTAFTHIIYFYAVTMYGKPEPKLIDISVNSIACMTLCSTIIICIVQLFYGYRVWILSKNLVVPIIIVIGSIAQIILGTWISADLFKPRPLSLIYLTVRSRVTAWFVITFTVDIIITVAVIYHLQRCKGLVLYTNHILNHASRLTLQTNLLTSILAIIVGVVYLSDMFTWATSIVNCSTDIYIISLLTSFNARPLHDLSMVTQEPQADGTYRRPSWVSYSCLYPDILPQRLVPNILGESFQEKGINYMTSNRDRFSASSTSTTTRSSRLSPRASTSSNVITLEDIPRAKTKLPNILENAIPNPFATPKAQP